MKNFVNRSVKLSSVEDATLERAVKRAVKSIFEREKSPIKRRILLDSIPLIAYHHTVFFSIDQEDKILREHKSKKSSKKVKKVQK